MPEESTVTALVLRARSGDSAAWAALVRRFAPLVWSVCRRHNLAGPDIEDVGQSVWLRLVEHLAVIEQPAALPGWLATTTRRQCLEVIARRDRNNRAAKAEAELLAGRVPISAEEVVLAAERNDAVRAALRQLPVKCQELLSLLSRDPPLSYAEISAQLQVPIGGLGPQRARCLKKLRRCPALAALLEADQRILQGDEV